MPNQPKLPPGIISKDPARTFDEHVAKINASPAFFEALASQPDPGPVINMNLLRYRPRSDSSRYDLYGAVAGKEIVAMGGDIILHGEGVTDAAKIFDLSDEWDGVAYVLYPRRSSYLQLQRDVNYQMGIADRVAGTYERMLYVISDGDSIYGAAGSITEFHSSRSRVPIDDGNVVLSEFLRFNKPDGRADYKKFASGFASLVAKAGGEIILSARAEMPVVSQEHWDHFVAIRFPQMEAFTTLCRSDELHEINIYRLQALDGSLAVMCKPSQLPTNADN